MIECSYDINKFRYLGEVEQVNGKLPVKNKLVTEWLVNAVAALMLTHVTLEYGLLFVNLRMG